MTEPECPLCRDASSEKVLWRGAYCRVIDVGDADYPGYCRVIWNAHVREMSDLPARARAYLMTVVDLVERALRAQLRPDKINLAALGNRVAHLHWHVIPRFTDDPHFPDAIWADRRRGGRVRAWDPHALARELASQLAAKAHEDPGGDIGSG